MFIEDKENEINIIIEEFKGLNGRIEAYKNKEDAQKHFDKFLEENFDGSKKKYDEEHGYSNNDIYWYTTELK